MDPKNMDVPLPQIFMNSKYRKTKTTVSIINYHFVFCSRYQRKIFLIKGVKERFKELIDEISKKLDIKILTIEYRESCVYLYINSSVDLSPSKLMYYIKNETSTKIRNEFIELSKIPSLWTRNYFVSTMDEISKDTIEKFIKLECEKRKSQQR